MTKMRQERAVRFETARAQQEKIVQRSRTMARRFASSA